MEGAIKKIKVTALCLGIKDRDRKRKPQRYDIGYLDHETLEQVTDEEIEKAKESAKLWSKDYKDMINLKIRLLPVELKNDKNGTIESFVMFTDKTINID